MRRNGGKTFRRQRFSPFRLHVTGLSGKTFRCDARSGGSTSYPNRRVAEKRENRRPILTAESPKSEKTGENRRIAEKRENRRIAEKRENRRKSPKRRQDRDAWKNVLNVRYCGVPRGTSISCSTWNVDKLLKLNNLCKNVLNVRIIRSAYSDYKLLVISNLTF